jgi:hypothetical protein
LDTAELVEDFSLDVRTAERLSAREGQSDSMQRWRFRVRAGA